MKKIIFSVALLNISLIFSAPVELGQLKKPKALPELTKEEREKASSEGFKCDYELIDAMIKNYPDKIGVVSSEDQPDHEYVTKTDSECRGKGQKFTECILKVDKIIHRHFLTKHIDSHHTWQDCICGKNSNISSEKDSSANHLRGYGFCDDENFTVNPKSRLKS